MIYAEGTSVRAGREEAIRSVCEIARLIEPTLGPTGSDVLITTPFGEIYTTNDGASIMRELPITHRAARLAADIALSQERSVGDGTTSTVVLSAYLLEELGDLIEREGLRAVLEGLSKAQALVEEIIEDESRPLTDKDLPRIVATALSGKAGEEHSALIARLLIESLEHADSQLAYVRDIGSPMRSSHRLEGILVDALPVRDDMPRSCEDPKLLLFSGALEARMPSGVSINSAEEAERFFASEHSASRSIAERIISSGATLVICRKGIDDDIQHELARAGIVALRQVPLEILETISRASGATIIPSLERAERSLGRAGSVHVDERGTLIGGVDASTIVVCGSTEHVADELLRAAHDAEGVLRSVRNEAIGVSGALVIESRAARISSGPIESAVGRAFERLARSILGQAPLPARGRGYDARYGREVDAWDAGIIEPVHVKRAAVSGAFEIARIIARIETIVSLPEAQKARI